MLGVLELKRAPVVIENCESLILYFDELVLPLSFFTYIDLSDSSLLIFKKYC